MTDARILLVDDDVALLEALPQAILLGMERIRIDTSNAGADALERMKEIDYDAIVTDVKMPGIDGLALLEEIGRMRPGTPTLLISGHADHELAVRALRGGAYDFVAKPIDPEYFIASLERAIELRRLDREVQRQQLALKRYARVLEHVDDGVFLVDDAGVIQHWNPAAAAVTGLTPSEVLGMPADDVLPDWHAVGPTVPVASAPGPGSTDARTLPFVIGGREIWLSISGVAVRGRRRLRVPEPDRGARARRAQGRVRRHRFARAPHAARRDLRLGADAAPRTTSRSTTRSGSACSR